MIEKEPGGNLIVAVDKYGPLTVEDHIIEVDRESGAIVNEWDLREILDMGRTTYAEDPEDWLHMNSVWYDATDDALVISGRNQTAVVKFTTDGELVWILGVSSGKSGLGIPEILAT